MFFRFVLVWAVGFATGCGDGNGGGSTETPLLESRTYDFRCTIDEVLLEMVFDLSFELDEPYLAGESSELTAQVAVALGEPTVGALIDAGVSKIDIISMEVVTRIQGATPSMLATSLAEAPINDFDLQVDTDQNGIAGPRHLALATATVPTFVDEGAVQVELSLGLDGISSLLGDFQVPNDCLDPSLVGFSASFPVGSAPLSTPRQR